MDSRTYSDRRGQQRLRCRIQSHTPHKKPSAPRPRESYFKEKVADKTCVIEKVESRHNNSDLGTKRIPLPLFISLASQLVDRSESKILSKPK